MDATDGLTRSGSPGGAEFLVLGPLEVRVGGRAVPIAAGARRSLLATLLLTPGRVVTVDRLVDAVWRDDPPADARGSVQTTVARLRRSLGPAGVLLRTQPPGYVLDVPPGGRDVDVFTRLATEARSELAAGRPAAALAAADPALALWRGPAWGDLPDDGRARGESLALDELRTAAEEDRAAALLQLGRTSEAVAALEVLAARHPLREGSVGLLADALQAAGRTPDALGVVSRYRERLADELGLDPSPAMASRLARLLRGEPAPTPSGAGRPAAASPTVPARLPAGPPGPLLGRAAELARIVRLLAEPGPVTLVGPGGVGKTRVALAAAAGSGRPAAWADLAALRDPGAVAGVVAGVLGVEASIGIPVAEALRRHAAGLRGLLVLDNCEHLLDAAAALVADLGAHAPGVSVLATSRERLSVPGERVVVVPPLDVGPAGGESAGGGSAGGGSAGEGSPAVELFVTRARSVDPDLRLEGADLHHVVEICRALDGLPLAIELAAARVGSLTVADLAQRLDTRFELLRHGPRSGTARHRTLRSVVDWSYDLLDEEEAAVFSRLAVFAARFDLDAAEQVVSGAGIDRIRVADVVARLVDRSMLTRVRGGGPGRYRMLDTLRRYALSRLPADEVARLQRRHASWVLDLLDRARPGLAGPEEAAWHARLEEAVPDLRLAWRLAATVADPDLALGIVAGVWRWAYWRLRVDLLAWAEDAVRAAPVGHPHLPQVLVAAAAAAWFSGDQDRAEELADRSLALSGGVGAPDAADALDLHGDISVVGGEPLRTARHCLAAASGHRAAGRLTSAAVSTLNAALALGYTGRADLDLLEAGLRAAEATGNPTARAFGAYALAETIADDDPDRAVTAYDEALRLASEVGNTLTTGVARTGRTALGARHGPVEDAVPAFRDVLRRWQDSGARSMVVTTLRNLVLLLVRAGCDRAALELLGSLDSAAEANPSYGLEAERLEQATATATARLGLAEAQEARGRGETRTLDQAAAEALHALERHPG